MVYVTLALEPGRLTGPVSLAWSAGGLHATTPRIKGNTVTCCVPRGIFHNRAVMRLQMVGSCDAEGPVFAWTQIPVLAETMFRAEMIGGRPVLSPLAAAPMHTGACSTVSVFD
jgi:hypothetical protein